MNFKSLAIAGLAVLGLASCHNPVFDYEGDCTVRYKIRFEYNKNLKWADAFPSEVNSVNLYAFNQEGVFVKEFLGRGEALSHPGYEMELDLNPGAYTLVAWCGLENPTKSEESFNVPSPVPGLTTLEELTCTLSTKSNELYSMYSDDMLNFLYHGIMDVELPDSQDGATYDYTMYLTKDTNHIRIMLQQLSAQDMNADDVTFRIESANSKLAHDNSLINPEKVAYFPWAKYAGEAGVGKVNTGGIGEVIQVDGVIADLTLSRMMAQQKDELYLTVTNKDGKDIIFQLPLIQYALLVKDYYNEAYGHNMSDQEFLDREDEYVFTFFLDENMNWVSKSIMVHSWRIVLNQHELE